MACIISAPASNTGKTLLSILITSWARCNRESIQTFKVGPDYLDPQLLSSISQKPCRNLDLILSGRKWVKDAFMGYGCSSNLCLVEGVMGLYDGLGDTEEGSTADIATFLGIPVVLVINASGQAASIAALVKGFQDHNPKIKVSGVVLNKVNSQRHIELLTDVLRRINIDVLGAIPTRQVLFLPNKNLGLLPAHEIQNLEEKVKAWGSLADNFLDMNALLKLLQPTQDSINPIQNLFYQKDKITNKIYPIALAQDKAFHFRYPETKECLDMLGMPTIDWSIIKDETIPKEAKGIIIPGGFPEQFAQEISHANNSINSLKRAFTKIPLYAECGGMLILGQTLKDIDCNQYPMAGLLPFEAKKSSLTIGYRKIQTKKASLITLENQVLSGHEFHRWELKKIKKEDILRKNSSFVGNKIKTSAPWRIKGWGMNYEEEGWSTKNFHASWIHLHWPSSPGILKLWKDAITKSAEISS